MAGVRDQFLHCWADERSQYAEGSEAWIETFVWGNGTCLLEYGHAGPHEFTPDSNILVTFR